MGALLLGAPSGATLGGGTTFEGNDGDLAVITSGKTDWANVAGLNKGIDDPSGTSDNSFGQGTKEDDPNVSVVSGSIPPQKSDLIRFYEASENVNNNNFLYLAWERTNVLGSANMDFEINQGVTANFDGATLGKVTINRQAGDLLVTYDFGGSGAPVLGLNTWVTTGSKTQCYNANAVPCWGNHVDLNGSNSEGAVNSDTVSDPIAPDAPRSLPGLTFGEAAINLTAAGVFPAGTCKAFGSAFLKSRSSASFPAEVKDFIAPVPVNISNCGSLTVKKVAVNDPGTTSFGYSTTGTLSPSSFNLVGGGEKAYTDVAAGSYSVTEGALPNANWSLTSLSCTATGSGTSALTSGATASITMAAGGAVTCTYTNTFTKNSPTIATVLSSGNGASVALGSSVNDTATLSGATANAGGSVTYTVYSNNTCTTSFANAGTKTVSNGVVPNSDSVTFNTAGTYYWQAVYTGDTFNNGATSACTEETLTVNKAGPTQSTAQRLIPDDSFTLAGGANPTGSITFNLYGPTDATCTGTPAFTQTRTVNGNGTYSTTNATSGTPFVASAEGTWRWKDTYSGDGNNNPVTSACGVEAFTIDNNTTN